jgi:L-alanine-DL-glutamate epimerase-like enolase superfamily enzyme
MTRITALEAFQMSWTADEPVTRRSAFVQIHTESGIFGLGEASPMMGGLASLGMIVHNLAPALIGKDALDHAILLDRLVHVCVKLGPEGALTGALAALDIALWDLKGKLFGQPVHKLLGGAWRSSIPLYSSIGGQAARTVDEVVRVVEGRVAREKPAAVKIRWDGDRTRLDYDIPGDIAKARAVRRLLGDGFPLAFDANNGYSVGGAIRVGRVLEDLGYIWFEEPVQHYHVDAMGEVARKLDITVAAGEQTYTLQALAQLIDAGVRMVQPDIIKMGGITGMLQCAALTHAHGVELVPHQTQPSIGNAANLQVLATIMHLTKPAEYAEPSGRMAPAFSSMPTPKDGHFEIPTLPGIGIEIEPEAFAQRRRPIA